MKLSSSSLGPALPLTLVDGNPQPARSEKPTPRNANQSAAPNFASVGRQSLLVITTSTASARAIQNALVPLDQKPLLRDSRNADFPTFKNQNAQVLPAPLLTFARSIAGAEFCLADGADPSNAAPGFDAVVWEFPQDDPDALVTAQNLAACAGPIPVIAVLFHAPPPPPQVDALAEAGSSAGLHSMVPVANLNTTLLEELIGRPSELSVSLSESIDQLCQAIRTHAHDVRNPLNCVQMHVDLMREQIKSSELITATTLDQLTSSVKRADAIVGDLSKMVKACQREHGSEHAS